jgi:hypothetical protein
VRDTFEDGVGDWSNRDGEVGATIALDNAATFDGTRCLKITDGNGGGNFAVNVRKTPFDVREFPIVQFDYKIPPDVKTNFLVKVSGRWYEIGFTDNPKVLKNKRVNVADIGRIEGGIADGEWHTAHFSLYDMLRTKTGNRIVEEMVMADWDVGGYMKLQFGHNRKGATYFIDNFTITREPGAGLRIAGDTLLVDDFNQRKATNALGGATLTFTDPASGTLRAGFSDKDVGGKGHTLELSYEVSKPGSFAGYISYLQNLDLREYKSLSFRIKGAKTGSDLLVGVKDRFGHEKKVAAGRFLAKEIGTSWQRVDIPLAVFSGTLDWGRIESLSLSFKNGLDPGGTIFVDDIEFHNKIRFVAVDDFERADDVNALGEKHITFASGAAAVRGGRTTASPNSVYRMSYGGNIGDIDLNAAEVFSYAGWSSKLKGIDCSECGRLSFRIRGVEGGEKPNIYLDDGNFRWPVDVGKFARITKDWQDVTIPLSEFAEYGVDLTHLEELQVVFEWEKMSGTVFLDDIRLGPN